jgi:glutamate--cysteine ligase
LAKNSDDHDSYVTSIDDLLEPFHSACKPPSEFRVGTEAEKFGWLVDEDAPLPFAGSPSVQGILSELTARFGWNPDREQPQGEIIALTRGQSSITLEPAGQLELSGAPFASIHDTEREFDQHYAELHAICEPLHVSWLSLGFHPFAKQAVLPHVPKMRYGIMETYLPTRGARALDMMRRTCTVQANLDFSSESDAIRKLRVGLALQPIATAMFANSPLYEGQLGPRASERAQVWLEMDPARSGILPFAWEGEMSFRKYVEWALDVPMFLIKRGHGVIANTDQTFRTFMRDGCRGERATLTDWRTHLNTLFPEARLKNTLEMRGADAQSRALTCALPALWKGLLYDEQALRQAESLVSPLTAAAAQSVRPELVRRGLQAELLGRPLLAWANEVLQIAHGALERFDVKNERGETEAVFLEGLESLVRDGRCPADLLRTELQAPGDIRERVIGLTAV